VTPQARKQAEKYLKDSLRTQKRLGYSSRVEDDVYEQAVGDAARAVEKMLEVQQRPPTEKSGRR
jgi:hypothetical protein